MISYFDHIFGHFCWIRVIMWKRTLLLSGNSILSENSFYLVEIFTVQLQHQNRFEIMSFEVVRQYRLTTVFITGVSRFFSGTKIMFLTDLWFRYLGKNKKVISRVETWYIKSITITLNFSSNGKTLSPTGYVLNFAII